MLVRIESNESAVLGITFSGCYYISLRVKLRSFECFRVTNTSAIHELSISLVDHLWNENFENLLNFREIISNSADIIIVSL